MKQHETPRKHFIYFLIAIIVFAMLAYGAFLFTKSTEEQTIQQLRGVQTSGLQFEIANTEIDREKGLSGRTQIPHAYGMLFVFREKEMPALWMKGMLAPIDILWLSDTGKVLGVLENISPDTYPNVFYPPEPVRYVLEMRAGEAQLRGYGVGTNIALPNNIPAAS